MEEGVQFSVSLSERPELLTLIQQFSHRPQAWIADEYWTSFTTSNGWSGADGIRDEDGSNRSQRRLAGLIEKHFNLDSLDYGVFVRPSNRFALLSPRLLERLTYQTGLMRFSPMLAASIHRNRVHQIIEQIGEESYREAISHGPLTVGANYKGVKVSDFQIENELCSTIRSIGWLGFGQALSGAPEGILQRTFLKFASSVSNKIEEGVKREEREHGITDLMLRILKLHVNRRAATCVF
ncbi:MAG: SctK family type III secretion system sorting platform protein [Verrucomicrobiota bacterium]